jgi:hypothetical protein
MWKCNVGAYNGVKYYIQCMPIGVIRLVKDTVVKMYTS